MLGVCLLFVGIVLINNGACALMKVEPKAAAVMDIFVGLLSVFINFVSLVKGTTTPPARGCSSGSHICLWL